VHIGPLVDQKRKVSVALNPLSEHVVDNCFTCGADDQSLFKLFASADCDQGKLRTEAFHMARLFLNERIGNELRGENTGSLL
jgi:hypothetical protein